ncbi:MAG: glycoside hydrolase family 2 protein [Clostridia bacterium]|nr:glycoside hydrolase family 2 protein [Clostridia bacterium]
MKQEIKNWKMIKDGTAYACSVPCSYYSVLLQNGLMQDPYYRDQEKYVASTYGDHCRFETEITVDKDTLAKRKQLLVFEGLDTLCDIYLNGSLLGKTDNMHRTWRFDVSEFLVKGKNHLVVEFSSAVTYFNQQHHRHPMQGNRDTLTGFAHLRKAFYMSGWDWGPTLPDMGIWRPVYLLAYDAKIADVEIRQAHLPNGSVAVTCKTEVDGALELRVETQLTDEDGKVYVGKRQNGVDRIQIEEPKLWWPNGYGEQALYTLTVKLFQGDVEIDSVTKDIGLRTITVSQEADAWGNEFCFLVNGIKIFAMGANYIPEENLLPKRSREKTEYLVRRCADANYNMIRVWGGGIYPDDWFFDLCDRYGLIVWQDFMFACNLVWLTDQMEQTVKAELIDNIKRIRHHASLGLLCGNNENEEFLKAYMIDSPMDLEKADYLRLYCRIMPNICEQYAPDTFYWSSSPHSGRPEINFADDKAGDRHIWTVWGGMKNIEMYQTYYPRFCSEFGFEAIPDIETVKSFTHPEDRNFYSEVMDRHQKNKNGNGKLMFYMAQYYRYPVTFEKVIYATQLMQADAIRIAVEHFRRNRGRCMGALYWQLNDCWPVTSWAAIDYQGRPKALYYSSKKFFAPILLSADTGEKGITLTLSGEQRSTFLGTVIWRLKDTKLKTLWEKREIVVLEPLSAKEIATVRRHEISAERERDTFLEYELYSEKGELLSRSNLLFVKPKQFRYPTPDLQVMVQKLEEGRFRLCVTANAFARKVNLSFANPAIGAVGDQYFDITTTDPVCLEAVTEDLSLTESDILASVCTLSEADLA